LGIGSETAVRSLVSAGTGMLGTGVRQAGGFLGPDTPMMDISGRKVGTASVLRRHDLSGAQINYGRRRIGF
jgi:hypothetical protein